MQIAQQRTRIREIERDQAYTTARKQKLDPYEDSLADLLGLVESLPMFKGLVSVLPLYIYL